MTKKRRTGLAIGAAAVCIAVLCVTGACNGAVKEEKAVYQEVSASTAVNTTATPLPTTTVSMTTTVGTTTEPQITTTVTCAATETTTTTTEQSTTSDTTVPPNMTPAPSTSTAPVSAESHHGHTSGDYIYVNGFGWVFNEGGGGYGETNYDMYCNGNKIGYFG